MLAAEAFEAFIAGVIRTMTDDSNMLSTQTGRDEGARAGASAPDSAMNSAMNAADAFAATPAAAERYELPPTNTVRWVARRKAQVVKAVRDGIISLEDACLRYALSVEEFLSWQEAVDTIGVDGLLTTGATARNRRRGASPKTKK